jgi:MSHA pilin protein MshC
VVRIPGSRGVTLVEMTLVLVILGILCAVGAPRFFSRSSFHERFFFDDSLAALRYAQKLAVASGCEVRVTISADEYLLEQRASCRTGAFAAPVANPGTGEASYTRQAPSGITLASSVNPIIFDSLGRALDASLAVADATVTVGSRSIEVVGETGFVFDPTG